MLTHKIEKSLKKHFINLMKRILPIIGDLKEHKSYLSN